MNKFFEYCLDYALLAQVADDRMFLIPEKISDEWRIHFQAHERAKEYADFSWSAFCGNP